MSLFPDLQASEVLHGWIVSEVFGAVTDPFTAAASGGWSHEGIHFQIRGSDSRRAVLLRPDAVSRLSAADHERLANGAVLRQLQYPLPGIETVSSGARGPREAAWRGFGPERRTAVSVSRGEGEERGTGAADRRARSH